VTIGTATRALNGTNVARLTDYLVRYTPAYGATTKTNQYGYEAEVIGGKVTKVANGVGSMAIPANGYVLSGHGASRTWLAANATVGATVTLK
jgi:PAB1-binding protein PBP1